MTTSLVALAAVLLAFGPATAVRTDLDALDEAALAVEGGDEAASALSVDSGTELDEEGEEAEEDEGEGNSTAPPPCCKNRGCCKNTRRQRRQKIQRCVNFPVQPGVVHANCLSVGRNQNIFPQHGGGFPQHGGGFPQHGGGFPQPGGGFPMHGGGRAPMQENEVCCMCSRQNAPKTWFPVPPSIYAQQGDANDADFRNERTCKSKCMSMCTLAGAHDFMNPTSVAGLTLGMSLVMDPHANPQLKHLAQTVFPAAQGCFREQYLAQIRGAGIQVIANPDDASNPWTGSFANIC